MNFARVLLLVCAVFLMAASGGSDMNQSFQLTSSAFSQGQEIPTQYSMEANNQVPPLAWSGIPEGTQELALVVDDPDAPKGDPSNYPWVHWVVDRISPTTKTIQEALQNGAQQGQNSFGNVGWGGPFPPIDNGKHRYFFHLYALDATLKLPNGMSKQQLMKAMEGHVIANTTLMGTYERTAQSAQAQKNARRRAG